MTSPSPARIHLLAARDVPIVVVIRRGPSKRFHVMRWNTQTDEIEHGSWFTGRLYEHRCDVSPDGEWMVYLAMGSQGETWTGICRPPFLRTVVHWRNVGTWHGGGVFEEGRLWANAGHAEEDMRSALVEAGASIPFRVEAGFRSNYGEDEGVLYPRLERDGWRLDRGPSPTWGEGWGLKPIADCPQWSVQPTPAHPKLLLWQRGYVVSQGRVFQFSIPDDLGLFDQNVTWATYDSLGQLLIARGGVLERYTLDDLARGVPSFRFDTNGLLPPERKAPPADIEKRFPITVFEGTATGAAADVLGLLHPSQEADDALARAGSEAQKEFARRSRAGLVPNRTLALAFHSLPFKALLFVRPTNPGKAIRAFLQFAGARRLRSIAFGSAVTKGHETACVEAVYRWLAVQDSKVRGRIVFVADGPDQAATLRDALASTTFKSG